MRILRARKSFKVVRRMNINLTVRTKEKKSYKKKKVFPSVYNLWLSLVIPTKPKMSLQFSIKVKEVLNKKGAKL